MNPSSPDRRFFLKSTALGSAALFLRHSPDALAAAAPAAKPVRLTMLNDMAGTNFEESIRRHVALGVKWLDLRQGFWGQTINNLSLVNAERVAEIARTNGLGVFCLSTGLLQSNLEDGEEAYRKRHFPVLDHVLKIADILQPQCIRLLSARVNPFPRNEPIMAYVERRHPWTIGVYREMVDRIVASGRRPLIENETPDVILDSVEGINRFFELLRRPGRAFLTWDVQNLWEMGVFPSLAVYRGLEPLMGCLHVKGGRSDNGKTLAWSSALEDASWPVADIVRAVIADGVAPFICINFSHGKRPPGYDAWDVVQRDFAFLRRKVSADL